MDRLAELGIDLWSILVYMTTTGLMVIVLTWLIYKPLLKFIDQRRKLIGDSIDEANLIREEFSKKLTESEKEKKGMEAELRQEMDNLRSFVEKKRLEMATEMEISRSEMMTKAQKEIEAQKNKIIESAEKEVMEVMTRIVLEIVQQKVPEKVIAESIEEAWKQYSKN